MSFLSTDAPANKIPTINPQNMAESEILQLRLRFAEDGYVKLPDFFSETDLAIIHEESKKMLGLRGRQHNFTMPAYETPRLMTTVGGKAIAETSQFFSALYAAQSLYDAIGAIAGRTVYPCYHPEEYMVINCLRGQAQTHGWHFDDPELALVVILEAPPEEAGAAVELIKCAEKPDLSSLQGIDHIVQAARLEGKIRREYHPAGTAYLLHASDILHRVTPLLGEGCRIAINMAFCFSQEQNYGDTAYLLYSSVEKN